MWGGAGTAMALDPKGPNVGSWARGSAAGLAGHVGGGLAGGGLGALAGGGLGYLAGGGTGARAGATLGGAMGALPGMVLGGRAGIEAATRGDAEAQGLTPEQHRQLVHTGMAGGFAGSVGGGLVGGLAGPAVGQVAGMAAAPALSHRMVKNKLEAMQAEKQASLDRGGYQVEDKDLDDRRLEQEAAFRESLQDAARANGEQMHGAQSMTGMPNAGSAITPSIPGY